MMTCRLFVLSLALVIGLGHPRACGQHGSPRPWNEDVIYFALTDRFYDGDAENNVPPGSDPALYDPAQRHIDRYHGGDFRGLEMALANGYFKELGVTAIWITPPVRNVWHSAFDSNDAPKTGYHGYWAQDFLDIDPHLISRRSLDGSRAYPDSRDGRMQHYKDLVALAHGQGIRIIQDIVCNHAGPVFFYDANPNHGFDRERKDEWVQPFKRHGFHESAQWADTAKWNQHRTAPGEPLTILGRAVKMNGAFARLESYGRKGMSGGSLGKSDGEEIECDFFGLRDFWTKAGSAHFDALVEDFVEAYAFYVEGIGVDGFRIDTVKHVHREFWDAFTERLRRRLGEERARRLILFGEVYDGNPARLGEYTYRTDWPGRREPALDSVLDFQFCFAVRSFLRTKDKPFGKARDIESALRSRASTPPPGAPRPFYNPSAGLDGLSAAQKMVNFAENHDGLNRFRVPGISERRNFLANALVLTVPGIPCLYYGTEVGLEDGHGRIGADSETGRLTFLRATDAERFGALRESATYKATAALVRLRREMPALTSAAIRSLWVDSDQTDADDGVFVFARGGDGIEPVIVLINASGQQRVVGKGIKFFSAGGKPLFAIGDQIERIAIAGLDFAGSSSPVRVQGNGEAPEAEFQVGPESVNLYRRISASDAR